MDTVLTQGCQCFGPDVNQHASYYLFAGFRYRHGSFSAQERRVFYGSISLAELHLACTAIHSSCAAPTGSLAWQRTRAGVSEASLWAAAFSARRPLLLPWLPLTLWVLQEQACCSSAQELVGEAPEIFVHCWVLMTRGRRDCASYQQWALAGLLFWPLHGPKHTHITIKGEEASVTVSVHVIVLCVA